MSKIGQEKGRVWMYKQGRGSAALLGISCLLALVGCDSPATRDVEIQIPLENGFHIAWLSGNNAGIEKEGYWYVGGIRNYAVSDKCVFGNSAEVAWFVLDMESGTLRTTGDSRVYERWLLDAGVPTPTKLMDIEEARHERGRIVRLE